MAAPTLVDSDTDAQTQGGDNQLNFTLSGGTPSDGDLLIAVTTMTTSSRQFSTPSGWTEHFNSYTASTEQNPLTQIFYKVAASEASGSYTFSFGSYGNGAGVLMRWSGADSADIGSVVSSYNQADDANIVSPATTPANADSIVLRIVVDGTSFSGTESINGPPTSHTRIGGMPIVATNCYALMCVDYRTQAASSSGTETYDAAPDYHTNFDAFTFYFGPSGGGGGGGAANLFLPNTFRPALFCGNVA